MNTVRLGPELQEKIRRVARRKGITLSDVHRDALEAYCAAEDVESKSSRFDDVIGIVEGPPDLSENIGREYAEAMSRKHGRHSA